MTNIWCMTVCFVGVNTLAPNENNNAGIEGEYILVIAAIQEKYLMSAWSIQVSHAQLCNAYCSV